MRHRTSPLLEKESRLALWMLLPAFTVVFLFIVFPALWNIWLSLKPVSLADLRGSGLYRFDFTFDNFRLVFSDPEFVGTVTVTLIYTFGGAFLSILLGLAASLLVNTEFRGRGMIRGLLISPYIAPVVAVTFTWSFLLDPQLGVLNWLAVDTGLIESPIAFFSQRWLGIKVFGMTFRVPLALLSVIFFEGWRYFPFAFLFILARLQNIPEELYHAASVDGATPLQKFRYVTVPQLLPTLGILFLFRSIWTINKFDDIFLLTGGQAGTKVLTIKVYEYAFGRSNIGAGSASAMVLFVILLAFILVYLRWILKERD
ncbi:MAG TPA: sugar ABC transporter permease [Desulfobacteraceae bacterium]|nr:sugar ABC transporter permease [Desulfobacteraceae bacterium]